MFNTLLAWMKGVKPKLKKGDFIEINGLLIPSQEIIEDVHDFLIETFSRTGESVHKGTRYLATLEHALNLIKYELKFTGNKETDVIERAAYLFNYLANGHVFVDGNKRTAYVVLLMMLTINKINISASFTQYKENHKFIIEISGRKTDNPQNAIDIIEWINKNKKN